MELDYCTHCLTDLANDEILLCHYEIITEYFSITQMPFITYDDDDPEAPLNKLEKEGFIVSTELDESFVHILPIGIQINSDKCFFCRNPCHNCFN